MRRALASLMLMFCVCPVIAADDEDLIFAKKSFYDSATVGAEGGVHVSGTLTGPDLGYRNNTFSISCFQERKECYYTSIEQIGPKQLGRMDGIGAIPIVKWNALEVVAKEEENGFSCARITITISRKTEAVLWVVEPTNQTQPACSKSRTNVMKWTIEDSLGWKRMNSGR